MSEPAIERAAVVALLRRGDRSWPQLAEDIVETGSAVTILREPDGQARLFDDSDELIGQALTEIGAWQRAGIGVHSILDATYPALLRDIRERPPILFSRGHMVDDPRAIAVVGSRGASDNGLRMAATISHELVRREITIVSGLASGIDTAAHTATLASGGRTVAVIGTGINDCYPSVNRALQQQISREGLVLSQFWPDAATTAKHFPMRNAIMSGYCAATVVVEAGVNSGVRIQTRLALQHGRQVVLLAELLALDWAREMADKPGVHVVRGLDELLTVVDSVLHQRRLQLSTHGRLAGILG